MILGQNLYILCFVYDQNGGWQGAWWWSGVVRHKGTNSIWLPYLLFWLTALIEFLDFKGGCLFAAGHLLTFSAFRMGAYLRWALIRGWVLIRINSWSPQFLEIFPKWLVFEKDVFFSQWHRWLQRKNPGSPNGSQTNDLLVTSPHALPLSYGRLVGAKAINLGSCDKHPSYC